jgi:biopolymer transport protein ExbD
MGFTAGAGGGPFSTGPKMNVTPLIDVLLVLIIVFMVVVIEQRPSGLQAELPHPANPNDDRDSDSFGEVAGGASPGDGE